MSTNPYQTPEGQLTIDDQAVGEIKFFSPSSRINRLRYWAHSMLAFLGLFVMFIVAGMISLYASELIGGFFAIAFIIVYLVICVIVIIQRLHDLNKSGWMALLAFVPLANIYLGILLIFFKGTEGRNNFGLRNPPNKVWHWIMAFSPLVFIALIGILAAITMPIYQDYMNRAQGVDPSHNSQDADAYPSEYTEDGAVEDTMFSDEALEDGISYETPEEKIIEDEIVDAIDAKVIEEPDLEIPQ